ncbi:MAG: sigma-70 family RNA polymerase sigma factor [Peptococcaceae bacterium]|nr:sigma-70 family RNA polymerase sigma factor [Peptococcaceae bacterium]
MEEMTDRSDENTQKTLKSFEAFYNQFYVSVYRFFTKRLDSKELCEDLTSDVFYACFKNFDRYDASKATMATWIYSIANNRIKYYYRSKKDYILADDDGVFMDLPDDDIDLDGAVFLSQMKTHLAAALESVTERERSVIMLRYYSDLPTGEIADKIGTTAGNVKVILTRALKKLANYFEENGIRWE